VGSGDDGSGGDDDDDDDDDDEDEEELSGGEVRICSIYIYIAIFSKEYKHMAPRLIVGGGLS